MFRVVFKVLFVNCQIVICSIIIGEFTGLPAQLVLTVYLVLTAYREIAYFIPLFTIIFFTSYESSPLTTETI